MYLIISVRPTVDNPLVRFNYEDLRNELINEVACSLMNGTVDEWLKQFKAHQFDISLLSTYFQKLREINCRRNLIVHNDSKVNRKYIETTKCNPDDYPLGKKIIVNKEYILSSYTCVMVLVYGILYASLKAEKSAKPDFLSYAFGSSFEHMLQNDWELSKFVYHFLANEEGQTENDKILARINYWISCKNIGIFESVKNEIETADFSAMKTSIRMAREMLLDHFESGFLLLDEAITAKEISPENVKTWPVFIQFRQTSFYDTFKDKYAVQMDKQLIPEDELGEINEEDNDDEINSIDTATE